jgi:hypothetical protein
MPKGERSRKLSDADRADVVQQYTTPASDGTWVGVTTIARQWGVRPQTIVNALTRAGVTLRSAREAHAHGKRCKPVKNLPVGDAPPCKCGCGGGVAWNRRKNRWNVYVAGHYRTDAPYKSQAWLEAAYLTHRRTAEEIAAACGVKPFAIYRYLRRFGIPVRGRSESRKGRHTGAANGWWKGGTTPERQRLYHTEEWKATVTAVFARDVYTCQRCGAPKRGAGGLHAHHIKSWAEHPDLRQELSNLITLCNQCHTWVHSRENIDHLFIG